MIGAQVLAWAEVACHGTGCAGRTSLDIADGAGGRERSWPRPSDIGADAIVMGTRGLRPMDAITVGSVSQEVCRTAKCTCIMVH